MLASKRQNSTRRRLGTMRASSNREASRHYRTGKDYAHAANQALTAHGHALHALARGRAAADLYVAQEGSPIPGYLARSADRSPSMQLAIPAALDGAAHHATAADHHDAAARHHDDAQRHVEANHRIRALHSTRAALDHALHALHHSNQAAMHHVMYLGSTAVSTLSDAAQSARTIAMDLPDHPGAPICIPAMPVIPVAIMQLDSWAAQRTDACGNEACGPRAGSMPNQHVGQRRNCTQLGRYDTANTLAGYCPMIWAACVVTNGGLVGTAVADGDAFRFFAADVRLDELDGLTWPTLAELRIGILAARSLILASLRHGAPPG